MTTALQPSGDTSGATDLAAINGALSKTGYAPLGSGYFCINDVVHLGAFQTFSGLGPVLTTVHQVSPAKDGVVVGAAGGTIVRPRVFDMMLTGPGSGTGCGIRGGGPENVLVGVTIRDVISSSFGGSGVDLNTPITSVLDSVNCSSNGVNGIYLHGNPTSLTMTSCYTNSNAGRGVYISDGTYMALSACASDSNAIGYEIVGGCGVALTGCGSEQTVAAYGLDGTTFKVNGGSSHSLTSCVSVGNSAVAFWVTGEASNVTMISCKEVGPVAGATASFKNDPGCDTVFISPAYVTEAMFSDTHVI
jgi:hypothetical protein